MNQPTITLVELAPTEFGRLDEKLMKDVYSRFENPARATPLLHSIFNNAGYKDVTSINTKFNPTPGRLTTENWSQFKRSDYVLWSSITRTQSQTAEAAEKVKSINHHVKNIIGGSHATYTDEECLEGPFDVVVRHEGDHTIVPLIERLENNESLEGLLGITFKNNSHIERNPVRPPLTVEEFSNLPPPVYDTATLKGMSIPVMIGSRGCPFDCSFCGVNDFYGPEYRKKSPEAFVRNLKYLEKTAQRGKGIFIGDDNFIGKMAETKILLDMMIESGLKRKYGIQIPALNARADGLAEHLYKANVRYAFLGFEALDQESLESVDKKSNEKINTEAAVALGDAGIWRHGMFILGLGKQDAKYMDYLLDWTLKYCDSVQFFSLDPIPGTKETKKLKEEGRIIRNDYHLHDGQHVLVLPENISPLDLQVKSLELHERFYSMKNIRNIMSSPKPSWKFVINPYGKHIAKSVRKSRQMQEHIEFLKRYEHKFY